jgi:FkbM family methyltransferase
MYLDFPGIPTTWLESLSADVLASVTMHMIDAVRRIRPAPLGSGVARILGLSRRRTVHTDLGTFFINPCSHLGYDLCNAGYEPGTVSVLKKHLMAGGTFIDLGANEGYFSVIASRLVGQTGKVIAVEPQSRLQRIIERNLLLNGCTNVQVCKAVITSRTAEFTLRLSSEMNTGSTSLYPKSYRPTRTEVVQGYSLADFLEKTAVGHCDLMKVDIEGGEYDAFMSAGEVLKAGIIKRIALEIHNSLLERRGVSGADLHNHILSCGYHLDTSLGHWVYKFI